MLNSFNPEIEPLPLHRVAVKDGLLLTAQLWQQAHNYHHQKQNLFYQSFHTPGIVTGLGVSVIQPPQDISAQYRDFRWLRIQPGVAIDAIANAIIVPQPIDFRIASTITEKAATVYLVISYVDPEELETDSSQEIIQETFRIDEKINPPEGLEIELCRILLQANSEQSIKDYLTNASHVLNPEPNAIDLRYRCQVGIRPQKFIKVGQIINSNSRVEQVADNFASLMRSLPGLYPQMDGDTNIISINLNPSNLESNHLSQLIRKENVSLIYLDYQQAQNLSQQQIEILKLWSQSGSTLLIEYVTTNTNIGELKTVQQQLIEVIRELEENSELIEEQKQFKEELESVEKLIDTEANTIIEKCQEIGERLGITTQQTGRVTASNMLKYNPFLFINFPVINSQEIDILNWHNLILIIGNLTLSWGINIENKSYIQRETIRDYQEMGINILNFAWQWHHLQSLYK